MTLMMGTLSEDSGYSNDRNSDENSVINIIVAEVIDALDIDGSNRDIFARLLRTNLRKVLSGRRNVLDNYYNNKLKKLLPDIYLNFDLEPSQIEIDTNHGDSSKLYSIMKEIKKRYDINNPKRHEIPKYFGKNDPNAPQCNQSPG